MINSSTTVRTSRVALALLGFASLRCSNADPETPPPSAGWPTSVVCDSPSPSAQVKEWTRYTVDAALSGAAFVSLGELNGDGRPDLVVSSFGAMTEEDMSVRLEPGAVDVYLQGDATGCWVKVPVVTRDMGVYFPNRTTLADADGDGDLDVFVPGGFFACKFAKTPGSHCGALLWMENQAGAWVRHDIVPPGSPWFYHSVTWEDFDGDGVSDLVTGAEQSADAETVWFKGDPTAPDRVRPAPLLIGKGGGSLPRVYDIDGDGDLDVGSAEYFAKFEEADKASFVWFERTGEPSASLPAGQWTRHRIDDQHGRAIMLDVASDLFGDGVTRWIGSNHTNANGDSPDPESAVFVFEVPSDPRQPWPSEQISAGMLSRPIVGLSYMAAPGVFGFGDIDADGDVDIAVSGDGDQRTFWLEQTAPGAFETRIIEEELGQASGAIVSDLDGDGRNELVFTGYEDNVVYVYER